MSLRLDHIVITVSDLKTAFDDYKSLGFNPIQGGEHANGITQNVLVIFEDGSYLELIAWKRPDEGMRWSDTYHADGEGFIDHALLPGDIVEVVKGAQARGLDISDPMDGGRLRPDGERLVWKTARSPGSDVPFLCGDVTPRRLRVQEDAEIRRQPNGVTGVAEITVGVRDVAASAKRYAALIGGEAPSDVVTATVLGTPARTVSLTLSGGTKVTLAEPTASGTLADLIEARGQGPVAVAYKGGKPGELDLAKTHKARMAIV
ncbi:VOC family protein [Enterovirga rhinocerotis]|uniref:Glyoxalase-like protein n=1 Tax=Enterovirga rhinocerotis TaxID=1339210 RepID=A0A4R7BU39_9HYPH|nr:VOC family protein [Enterovirga rhinocerotis]TDR89274.1 glyoxalase-like protein [Enterovirga rhinocerotis]